MFFRVSQLTSKRCRKTHNAVSAHHTWWVEAVTVKVAMCFRSGNLGEESAFKIRRAFAHASLSGAMGSLEAF